jgi:hypothetical protein
MDVPNYNCAISISGSAKKHVSPARWDEPDVPGTAASVVAVPVGIAPKKRGRRI